MRLQDMHQEEDFDALFQRASLVAQLEEELAKTVEESQNRRGSLPTDNTNSNNDQELDNSHHRRAKSCKVTSTRRKHKNPIISCDDDNVFTQDESASLLSPSSADTGCGNLLSPGYMLSRSPKSHSAPHSRSSSWKKGKRPSSRERREDCNANEASATDNTVEDTLVTLETLKILQKHDLCPVRSFTISSKGIKNRGDSFKRKSEVSLTAMDEPELPEITSGSIPLEDPPSDTQRDRSVSVNSTSSTVGSSCSPVAAPAICDVIITGSHGVGKTALIQQFLTSEYMGACETSFDDESEKTVSVLLDGEETTMNLSETTAHQCMTLAEEKHAYVVIYSVTERTTFERAEELLKALREKDTEGRNACILVGNKSDVVRSRQISQQDGKELATRYDAKFIEVSAVLNHKVDDLLVGVVKQIRLAPKRQGRRKKTPEPEVKQTSICVPKSSRGFFTRLFRRTQRSPVSRSCDNLLVD